MVGVAIARRGGGVFRLFGWVMCVGLAIGNVAKGRESLIKGALGIRVRYTQHTGSFCRATLRRVLGESAM